MLFKKSIKEVKAEMAPYIEEGDLVYAGIIAENEGYKKLANKYYDLAVNKFIEKNSLASKLNRANN